MKPQLVLGEKEFDELMAQHHHSNVTEGTSSTESSPVAKVVCIPLSPTSSTLVTDQPNPDGDPLVQTFPASHDKTKIATALKSNKEYKPPVKKRKRVHFADKEQVVVTVQDEICDENCELTTLRMLVTTTEVTSIPEFVECCQEAKILPSRRSCLSCPNKNPMTLFEVPYGIDGCLWKCEQCEVEYTVRQGTWLEECQHLNLKDIVLSLYGWARGWSKEICQLETSIQDIETIAVIYEKCRKLADHFFSNELCNIGGPYTSVDVDVFKTKSGLTIVSGLQRQAQENLFFRIMPDNYCRDDVVTALIDNIHAGTDVYCKDNVRSEVTEEGIKFMHKNWGLNFKRWKKSRPPIQWKQIWWLYMKSVMLENVRSTSHLHEYLFRRRMSSHRDSFLYLIFVIGSLYPPPT